MKTEIDIKKLEKITKHILKKTDVYDFNLLSSLEKRKIIRRISKLFFKTVDFSKVQLIFNWYERDTHGFKCLIDQYLNKIKSMKQFKLKIKVSFEDWTSTLSKFVSESSGRQRFSTKIESYFSKKLNEEGINCNLKCLSNWFRKKESRKKNVPFWNGKFVCTNSECKIEYFIKLHDIKEFDDIMFEISFGKTCNHVKNTKKERVVGEERIIEGKKLLAYGVTNVFNENVIKNRSNGNYRILNIYQNFEIYEFTSLLRVFEG